jgi:hypothetical protein
MSSFEPVVRLQTPKRQSECRYSRLEILHPVNRYR